MNCHLSAAAWPQQGTCARSPAIAACNSRGGALPCATDTQQDVRCLSHAFMEISRQQSVAASGIPCQRRWRGVQASSRRLLFIAAATADTGPLGELSSLQALTAGDSAQEDLASEQSSLVGDLVDADRTVELISWLASNVRWPWEAAPSSMQSDDTTDTLVSVGLSQQGQDRPVSMLEQPTAASALMAVGSAQHAANLPYASSASSAASVTLGDSAVRRETATFGGGCFWCLDACFRLLEGVLSVTSGFAGGFEQNPTYQQVVSGNTGHAEVVQVSFDPAIISYRDLLQVFFSMHDPRQKDRQGNDVGTQYRSIILYQSEAQQHVAQEVLKEVSAAQSGWFRAPVVTQLQPLVAFYSADSVHQNYAGRNPQARYCALIVSPKVSKVRSQWASRLKDRPIEL